MSSSSLSPAHLRAEHLVNPLALNTSAPRLSWVATPVNASARGLRQSACQIQAARTLDALQSERPDLWDSGKFSGGCGLLAPWGGRLLQPFGVCHWRVRLWDQSDQPSPWSAPACLGIGPMSWHDWSTAQWIGPAIPDDWSDAVAYPAAMLRRPFSLSASPRRAVLYASARGLYEAYLNGQRIGEQELAPEWTDYHRRAQFQAYDVTDLLADGENVLSAQLADGWACGRIGLSQVVPNGGLRGFYHRRPRWLALLRIENSDGSIQTLVSDRHWRCSTRGPIRAADIIIGQDVDQRAAQPGWDRPGFDDGGWDPVTAEPRADGELVPQPNEPIRVTQALRPQSISEPRPGVFVADLGQNFAGRCRLRVRHAPAGTEIRLRHAEVLDGNGMIYRDNLRLRPHNRTGAPQEDRYISGGADEEVFEPQFTYHGFRYVEMTGLPGRPSADDLVGHVLHSAVRPTLQFQCSDDSVNRLVETVRWTLRSNLHSTPTDCPQRDERLGWMGDMQVFAQSACYLMDMAAFFAKWFADIRDAQGRDGRFPDFAPHPWDVEQRFHSNPGWADAGVLAPWRAWVNYADRAMLESHYDAARRWIDLVTRLNPEGLWLRGRGVNLEYGDWLNGDTLQNVPDWPNRGGQVPGTLYATAFYAHSTQTLSQIAGVLGRASEQAQYTRLAARVREAFVRTFADEDGRLEGDTQAGYALALSFDLLPERLRPRAAAHLRTAVERYGGRLSTGIQSTVRIMNELTRWGFADLAYDVLLDRRIPSWLYMLDHGGTTVWERWDGYVEGRQPSPFQAPGMNSFNHYAIGAVLEWIVRTLGGLHPDESAPGYERFELKPVPDPRGRINAAQVALDSPRGLVRCAWRRDVDHFSLEATVPPGSTATLHLPVAPGSHVRESDRLVADQPIAGIAAVHRQAEAWRLELQGGSYRFDVSR
jgi:alpha-L-rhamnosidase